MAKKHLGLAIYGCALFAILRGLGVASAPVQGETPSVESNQITDLEEQLKQQSGENKSSQPAVPSVDQGDAYPPDAPAEDALADDVQATGLSSDYYVLPSSEDTIDATQPERIHDQLAEDNNDEDKPAAAEAKEEDANSDEKPLDEEVYNGHEKEGMDISLEERSFEDDAEEIENHEKNREIRKEDDIEQIERPWKEESDTESQEAPPNGAAPEMEKLSEGEAEEERKEEYEEQPRGNEYEQETKDDPQKLERQRYEDDGKENTDKTLLIEREKKTFQGRTLTADLDKSRRLQDGERLKSDDDDFAGYV